MDTAVEDLIISVRTKEGKEWNKEVKRKAKVLHESNESNGVTNGG